MTVCVSVKVHDCLVFAADSALTMTAPNGTVENVYNHGNKVFNLHRKYPIGAMFCGMGTIGTRSISSLSKELRHRLMIGEEWRLSDDDYTIEGVAQRAHEFILEKYAPHAGSAGGTMEFFVGGFGAAAEHGELWKIVVANDVVQEPAPLRKEGDFGVDWAGQVTPISRLLTGIDSGFVSALMGLGVSQDAALAAFQAARESLKTSIVFESMPTGDAVRLADFLVDVTKGYYSFAPGADIVGGDTDIAAVSKWEGFRWVRRKHYYPASLNGESHGHVC